MMENFWKWFSATFGLIFLGTLFIITYHWAVLATFRGVAPANLEQMWHASNLLLGAVLGITTGAGIAAPIAYNAGKRSAAGPPDQPTETQK